MHAWAQAKDPALAATQVSNAMRFLPPESVLAFNIGNEADAFTCVGGVRSVKARDQVTATGLLAHGSKRR